MKLGAVVGTRDDPDSFARYVKILRDAGAGSCGPARRIRPARCPRPGLRPASPPERAVRRAGWYVRYRNDLLVAGVGGRPMSSGDDCDKFAMIGDNASEAELAMSSLPGHGHSNWRSDRDYGPWRKDRSYWPRSGWASSPTNMAGTPSKMVARSRRIAASKQRQDRDHHVVGLDVEQAPGDVRVHAELHVRQLGGLGAGCRPRQHAGPGDEIRAPQWPRWNPTSGACSRPAASRSESASSSP